MSWWGALLAKLLRWIDGEPLPRSPFGRQPDEPPAPTSEYQRGFLRGYREGRGDAEFGN